MLRAAILSAAVLSSTGVAIAQQIEGLHGPAAETLAVELRKTDFLDPMQVNLFYGDLTGRGTKDAVALIYHPSGGNSDYLDEWLLRDVGGRYEVVKDTPLGDIVGDGARDILFAPGRFEVTMTVMNPGDPRCCPTGEKRFVIVLDDSTAQSSSASGATANSGGAWTARQTTNPVGVDIEAISIDGRSRIEGGCGTEFLEPGFWLTFFHDGDALERRHQKPEPLLLEITGSNDVQYFTASTSYEGPGDSWVADRPLPEAFLDAFAAGNQLRVTGGGEGGGEIAGFGLRGTSRAVATMREICGPAAIAAAIAPVALPFADGRYLSDPSLCGLDDSSIVDRIGDDIHYALYTIKNGQVGGAESLCDVRDVSRDGNLVRMNAECTVEGMVNVSTLEMTYISDTAFRSGERVFERCD
ncbi:hypothetical protein VQ042_00805 [Aurantimonas sp. A2-1-M11]|uniref:hypothetical protein n=1 Tax=Aurantimonas sp. A2-1-M11 TaxID=3113712 RepID=UPI002F94B348